LNLGSSTTLGVTWTGTSTDEADMALNTDFNWNTDGTNDFDVETVFLHENGHALGLGHTFEIGSVMYPSYKKINRDLQQDDIAGVSFLYPATNNTDPEPSPGESNVRSIEYELAGGKNDNKHLLITIHVVDDSVNIAGADVSISISNDSFRKGWTASGTTSSDGKVTFQLSNVRGGCYSTIVNSVASDFLWDENQPQDSGFCKS
jgi:hypothetical protein